MSEVQTHRFGLYESPPLAYAADGVPIAEADSIEAARRAVTQIVEDAIEAGETPKIPGIWDSDAREWSLWPWPCSGCGMTTRGPGLCPDCRSDLSLGNRVGQTRRDHEREIEDDRRARERDVWEPRDVL